MNKTIKFIDLFAGIGGIRLGFEQAGYECVFSSEINNACQEVYKSNFNETPYGDITTIDIDKIPQYDILTAGFPCQPFSVCGKQQGFNDTRGTLFFNICEIIKKTRPKVVFLENVKHLLHHDKGNTLAVVISSLESLGYIVSYKVLNAKDFGVPQNRERIIIIGTQTKYFNFSKIKKNIPTALKEFLIKDDTSKFLDKKEYTLIDNPITQKSGLIFAGYRNKSIRKIGVKPNTEHLSRVHKQPNRIYSVDGVHPTIPSQEISGRFFVYFPDDNNVRKLSIRECYKIMGFPDSFKLHKSLSEAYKQVGNSVCVPMIKELALQLKSQNIIQEYANELQRETNLSIQELLFS